MCHTSDKFTAFGELYSMEDKYIDLLNETLGKYTSMNILCHFDE